MFCNARHLQLVLMLLFTIAPSPLPIHAAPASDGNPPITPPSKDDGLLGFRYEWVLLAGSPAGNDRPYAIDVDSHGNPILAGMLQQNASFGPLVLDLNRKRSAFAAKVDHLTGLPLWVNPQIPEQDGTASAVDIAVDGEDNIVVMGTFKGDMTLGNVALQGNTLYGSVFLAHYHRNGTLLWATEVNGTGSALVWGCAIAIEPLEGSLYLGGYFGQVVSFGGVKVSSEAVQMFLARYDLSNGELSWVSNGMPTTGTLPSYATDITMQFKSPLVVGTFFEYIQLGEITLNTSAGGRGIFVARYNSSTGEATAARSLNGSGICYYFHQLDTDPDGNHFIAGCFTGNISLSPNVTLNGSAVGNTYVAKFSSKAELLWATYINSLATKYYTIALCADVEGSVYIAGYYSGVLQLNGTVVHASRDNGIYILKLSANGTLIWLDVLPGMFSVGKMMAYSNNTVYLAGSVRGEALIGDHYVYSLNEEIFLFKMTTTHLPRPLPLVNDGMWYKLGLPLLFSFVLSFVAYVVWQHWQDTNPERKRVSYQELRES